MGWGTNGGISVSDCSLLSVRRCVLREHVLERCADVEMRSTVLGWRDCGAASCDCGGWAVAGGGSRRGGVRGAPGEMASTAAAEEGSYRGWGFWGGTGSAGGRRVGGKGKTPASRGAVARG